MTFSFRGTNLIRTVIYTLLVLAVSACGETEFKLKPIKQLDQSSEIIESLDEDDLTPEEDAELDEKRNEDSAKEDLRNSPNQREEISENLKEEIEERERKEDMSGASCYSAVLRMEIASGESKLSPGRVLKKRTVCSSSMIINSYFDSFYLLTCESGQLSRSTNPVRYISQDGRRIYSNVNDIPEANCPSAPSVQKPPVAQMPQPKKAPSPTKKVCSSFTQIRLNASDLNCTNIPLKIANTVADAYQYTLKRTIDQVDLAGYNFHVSAIMKARNKEQACKTTINKFLYSAEHKAINFTARSYAQMLFQTVLDRSANSTGANFWAKKLGGLSQSEINQVVNQFYTNSASRCKGL